MERTPVSSSNIVSAGYDEATRVMEVEFKTGKGTKGVYSYADVPKDIYDAFLAADSKGSFFHASIKGKYETRKL
jgi:hypothetical protein